MKKVALKLPEPYIDGLDLLVSKGYYSDRSEAIRNAVHDMISDTLWARRRPRQHKHQSKKTRKT